MSRARRECENNPSRQWTDVSLPPVAMGNSILGKIVGIRQCFSHYFPIFSFPSQAEEAGKSLSRLEREAGSEVRAEKKCCFQKSFSGFEFSLLWWEVSGRDIHIYMHINERNTVAVKWDEFHLLPKSAHLEEPQVASRGDFIVLFWT